MLQSGPGSINRSSSLSRADLYQVINILKIYEHTALYALCLLTMNASTAAMYHCNVFPIPWRFFDLEMENENFYLDYILVSAPQECHRIRTRKSQEARSI